MAADLGVGRSVKAGDLLRRRALLVVAHPGHELRVHHWLERARPEVLILTDGGGRSGRSRLPATERLLARTGARPGAVFGRLSDRAMYAAILERRTAVFLGLAEALADRLLDVDYVVGDAAEGYNPAHDVCRLLIDAAVARASIPVPNLAFPLAGRPDRAAPGAIRLALDEDAFARKLAAARAYEALDGEVEDALRASGADAFRVEALEPATPGMASVASAEPPAYERHGEDRVARGFYTTVLRRREHVLPIAAALGATAPR